MPGLLHLGSSSGAAHYPLRLGLLAGAGLLVAVSLAATRLQRLEVSGRSMVPTLDPGDRVLAVRGRRARRGDLVVVPDPRQADRLVVKRVVGISSHGVRLAGDNPAASTDSRHFGVVPPATVRGRVVYRYLPNDRRAWIGRLVP